MLVENIMTKKVVTVELDTEVKQIKKIFHDISIHHVIVVENKVVRGVISDRDVLKCVSPYVGTPAEEARDTYTLTKKAHQIMSRKVISVNPTTPLRVAAKLLLKENISNLPVVDESNILKGIISWKDLLRAALKERD